MKAVVCEKYGPPDVQKIKEVEKPTPNENEVLIKVIATTVNRTDTGFRSAKYFITRFFTGLFKPKIKIFGTEFAGIIEEAGKNVKEFKKGDKVFGFNDKSFGAHAEFLVNPSDGVITKIPKNFDFIKSAPMSEGAQYALNNIKFANVKKGDNVLIYGASGSIGSAAIQICKYLGANITGVTSTKNLNLVSKLGAKKVIDYKKEDFKKTSEKYDFIFDAVGKTSYGKCKKLLKPNGKYCSTELGKFAQNPILAIWFKLNGKRKVIMPIPKMNKENLEFLKELAEKNKFTPVIDKTYKLEDIVEATKYVESGRKVGNVVILVN